MPPLDWRELRIGDLVASGALLVSDGYRMKNEELATTGIPFVRGGDIEDGWINTNTTDHIRADLIEKIRSKLTRPGDAAFITKGTVGRAGFLREGQPPVVFAPQVAYWRSLDPSKLAPRFLYYLMKSSAFIAALDADKTHGAMAADYVSISQQLNFRFIFPPVREQQEIASVLGALDDKIELNRRMNETLEQIAQALFKNWFESIRETLPREQVGQLCKLGAMAIGDGYRAKNEELRFPGLPFIRAGDLNDGIHTHSADFLSEASVVFAGDKLSRVGDVAFTSKGTIGRFARVTKHTDRFVYSPQVCFWRSLDAHRLRPSILYVWMTSADLTNQIRGVADQSDMAPYVSLRDQRAMTMPLFDDQQHAVADMLDPLFELQAANIAETRTLAETRDYLLPKLMSGDVRVRNFEKRTA